MRHAIMNAEFVKAQTLSEGGFRLTFDVPDIDSGEVAGLIMWARQRGLTLTVVDTEDASGESEAHE